MNCGNALEPNYNSAIGAELGDALSGVYAPHGETYTALCEDRISTQRIIAFPIAGIGALCLLFLALTRTPTIETTTRPESDAPQTH